jgi:hypothetical protein
MGNYTFVSLLEFRLGRKIRHLLRFPEACSSFFYAFKSTIVGKSFTVEYREVVEENGEKIRVGDEGFLVNMRWEKA